ncbi:hypothetical protein [Chryseobacterium balustinum]|uniref:hypothetical protein n=1 Tax=Chryseobacterium balustinum TaxID=246 RepID=UPI003CF38AF3
MEQILDIQTPTEKIYRDRAIWVGTFLSGPLAAGYLIAENFKAFNDTDKAKKTWIYAIISTIVVFGGVFLIPDNVKILNHIIPLIYTAIAYYLVQHFQGHNISTHISSGGQLYSWWRTIAVGIIGLAITVIPIFGFTLLSDSIENASVTTNTYGVIKHEIAYDRSNISETEVNKIADGFTKATFFDEAVTKYVYAKKVNNKYELSLSVVDGIANDSQALQPFIDLRTDLQTLFPNNKIVFKLVVDNLDNVVKTIE